MSLKRTLTFVLALLIVGGLCQLAFGQGAIPLDQAVKDGKVEVGTWNKIPEEFFGISLKQMQTASDFKRALNGETSEPTRSEFEPAFKESRRGSTVADVVAKFGQPSRVELGSYKRKGKVKRYYWGPVFVVAVDDKSPPIASGLDWTLLKSLDSGTGKPAAPRADAARKADATTRRQDQQPPKLRTWADSKGKREVLPARVLQVFGHHEVTTVNLGFASQGIPDPAIVELARCRSEKADLVGQMIPRLAAVHKADFLEFFLKSDPKVRWELVVREIGGADAERKGETEIVERGAVAPVFRKVSLTWHRYGWLEVGVEGDGGVRALRVNCPGYRKLNPTARVPVERLSEVDQGNVRKLKPNAPSIAYGTNTVPATLRSQADKTFGEGKSLFIWDAEGPEPLKFPGNFPLAQRQIGYAFSPNAKAVPFALRSTLPMRKEGKLVAITAVHEGPKEPQRIGVAVVVISGITPDELLRQPRFTGRSAAKIVVVPFGTKVEDDRFRSLSNELEVSVTGE